MDVSLRNREKCGFVVGRRGRLEWFGHVKEFGHVE